MHKWASFAVLLLALGMNGCGGSASAPTAPVNHHQNVTATVTGVLASHDWSCWPLNDQYEGPVTLSLAPENPIELSTGACDSPLTPPIAHDDHGYIANVTVTLGAKRVRMFNPTTGFPQFQLTITTEW